MIDYDAMGDEPWSATAAKLQRAHLQNVEYIVETALRNGHALSSMTRFSVSQIDGMPTDRIMAGEVELGRAWIERDGFKFTPRFTHKWQHEISADPEIAPGSEAK